MSEKKTKRKYYNWSQEDLRQALRTLNNKTLGLNACSRVYGIPKPTLKRHLANQSDEIQKGRPTTFSDSVEKELCRHILEMEQCMFGLTSLDVRRLAYQIAEKNKIQHNFNKTKKMAGKCWYYKFMERHPELSLRRPEATSINRIKGFNRENVMDFYTKLENIVNDTNITPNNVFNVDETGFSTVQKRTQKVIGQRGKKQIGSVASGERGVNTTAVCAASASGQYIPPMIIFKRKRTCPQLKNGSPPGSIVTVSDTGYINSELFVDWLKHFISIVKPSQEKKVLLLLDGHTTHSKNLEAIKLARENGIILLQLPGHTTHRLQPLDVAVFGPLGTYYIQEVETWMRSNSGRPVTQYEVAHLFNQAYQRAATVGNAVSGFKATGVWPVNRHVFQDHHFLAAETFNSHNDANEPDELPGNATLSASGGNNTETHDLSHIQSMNMMDKTESNASDSTNCDSPTLFENHVSICDITNAAPKYKQPDSLIMTAWTVFKREHLAEKRIPHKSNESLSKVQTNSDIDTKSVTQNTKRSGVDVVKFGASTVTKTKMLNPTLRSNDIVNLGASTSKEKNILKPILKVPIKQISPLPKQSQTNSRKRGVQKTIELTSSPYKNDLEESIQKREMKKPKIKLEEEPVKKKVKRGDSKTDKNKDKKKGKRPTNTDSNKKSKKKAITQNKKKRNVVKRSETESSETEEEIILDDDSDVELDEEYDDNYCSVCNGYYFDKKGPKVDWIECIRCRKWLHITCSQIPDICPKCLK